MTDKGKVSLEHQVAQSRQIKKLKAEVSRLQAQVRKQLSYAPITKGEIERLKHFAEKAFRGPWYMSKELPDPNGVTSYYTIGPFEANDRSEVGHAEDTICQVVGGEHDPKLNADYIAAADPTTILRLIERLEAVVKL